MRVLVLGAYGLVGAEIVRVLKSRRHDVVGLVRSKAKAARLSPGLDCIERDIARLKDATDWRDVVSNVDAVVNAAGALQDGLRDDVAAVQDAAIRALIKACEEEQVGAFVQISAPGADQVASTEFMRSKARADAALRDSRLSWVIFKPGLVIARAAYGGTALIRALAGFPLVQPIMAPDTRLQTVSAREVGEAVAAALAGDAPMRRDYDLVSELPYALADIVAMFREWLGFAPALLRIVPPKMVGLSAAKLADAAGWLGWRAPFRTTALKVLEHDVRGDPAPWRSVIGRPLKSLEAVLADMPATGQERLYARAQLALPAAILLLSLFFIASGVIGLFQMDRAAALLSGALGDAVARFAVVAGAVADIVLGVGVLIRPLAKPAAVGMIVLSMAYCLFGAILTPDLMADPLGPLLKILPVIGLAAMIALLLEER